MFSFNYLLLYNKITTSGWLQVTSVYYFCIWYWLGPLMRLHSAASSGEGAIFEMTSLVSGTLTGIVGIAGGWRVLSLCTSSLVIQLSSLNLNMAAGFIKASQSLLIRRKSQSYVILSWKWHPITFAVLVTWVTRPPILKERRLYKDLYSQQNFKNLPVWFSCSNHSVKH